MDIFYKIRFLIDSFFNPSPLEKPMSNDLAILIGISVLIILLSLLYLIYYLLKERNKHHSGEKNTSAFEVPKEPYKELRLNISKQAKKGLIEVFQRRLNKFMEDSFLEFLETRSPAFFQDRETKKIKLKCFPNNDEDLAIEELYTFWEMGFHHPELPLIFAIYFASRGSPMLETLLLELLNYKAMNLSQKNLIWLYFQDVLKEEVNVDTFPIDELEKKYQTDNLLFSQLISSYQDQWDRKTFKMQIGSSGMFDKLKYSPQMKDLLMLFFSKSTPLLTKFMCTRFAPFLGKIAEEYISSITFKYGDYSKLLKIDQPSSPLDKLINRIFQNNPQQESLKLPEEEAKIIIDYLSEKPYSSLHIFYYLKSVNAPVDEIKRYGLNADHVKQIIKKPLSIPIRIRWIFFQYLVHIQEWEKALGFYHTLGVYRNKLAARLFRLRCLFYSENRKTKYLNQIKALWEEYPKDLSIMNEYAIHCFEMNKKREAQKVFRKMQKQTPSHPITLYNQAIFFETIYAKAIKKKWGKLRETEPKV